VATNYTSSEVYIAIQYFDVKIQVESLSCRISEAVVFHQLWKVKFRVIS